MLLNEIGVENYKSFLYPVVLKLEPGFNLFVGANNSGKTTVLESLQFNPSLNVPHRSVANIPVYGSEPPLSASRFGASIRTDFFEYCRIAGPTFTLPISQAIMQGISGSSEVAAQLLFQRLCDSPEMQIAFQIADGTELVTYQTVLGDSDPVNMAVNQAALGVQFNFAKSGELPTGKVANFGGMHGVISEPIRRYRSRIYRFSAQRLPLEESHSAGDSLLQNNASNLPYCINHLATDDAAGHRILCEWIHRVFPSVKWVQAPPVRGDNKFQLQCLPEAPDARRNDLSVPLGKMGSGIGNVIAILYVVLTARDPQVIAIDEPNSFLHPKALRELLNILAQEGNNHQYILTAHSPDVLTAVTPATISLFELKGSVTTVQQVPGKDLPLLRTQLADLGIRMTDLHGRDNVLWVEGQTEELVFPSLLQQFCPEVSSGTAVLRVEHTGLFERKAVDPKEVAAIYKRLSTSSALVPPMIAILLDKEGRKDEECKKINAETQGAVVFLERRMLEDYVLIPGAIQAVLNNLGLRVSIEEVTAALDNVRNELKDGPNAAKILNKIFSDLSGAKHEFRKTRDTPMLFAWMLANQQQDLSELKGFLRDLFKLPMRPEIPD